MFKDPELVDKFMIIKSLIIFYKDSKTLIAM